MSRRCAASSFDWWKLRFLRRRGLAVVIGAALTIAAAWLELSGRYDAWKGAFPDLAAELERRWRGELPAGWDAGDVPPELRQKR